MGGHICHKRSTVLINCFILLLVILPLNVIHVQAAICGLDHVTEELDPLLPPVQPHLLEQTGGVAYLFYEVKGAIKAYSYDDGSEAIVANLATEDFGTMGVAALNPERDRLILAKRDTVNQQILLTRDPLPYDVPSNDQFGAMFEGESFSTQPVPISITANNLDVILGWLTPTSFIVSTTDSSDNVFNHVRLARDGVTGGAVKFVPESSGMLDPRTALGVYQNGQLTTAFRVFMPNMPSPIPEIDIDFVGTLGDVVTYLDIGVFPKLQAVLVVAQINQETVLMRAYNKEFTPMASATVQLARMPSISITPLDEIILTYVTGDLTACTTMFVLDVGVGSLKEDTNYAFCTPAYAAEPGQPGVLAQTSVSRFVFHRIDEGGIRMFESYKCNLGCGNGVWSAARGEDCDGSPNCDNQLCKCSPGYSAANGNCNLIPTPSAPVSPPTAAPTAAPTTTPTATPVASPTSTPTAATVPPTTELVPDVVPILDCSAPVNSTHYRSFWSYRTKNLGVASVNVPIGEQNQFQPINANQGQPTTFLAGRSPQYFLPVDASRGQSIEWRLRQYSLIIAETDSPCSNEIELTVEIVSPTPPSEAVINATIDYVATEFNVSQSAVNVTVTNGTQPNSYNLNVVVTVPIGEILGAIVKAQELASDPSDLEDEIKSVSPDTSVTGVRGRSDNEIEGSFVPFAQPVAFSGSSRLLGMSPVIAIFGIFLF